MGILPAVFLFAFIQMGIGVAPGQAETGTNKAWCEEWCKSNYRCDKCSDKAGCGFGYKEIATFKWFLDDDHWHACSGAYSEQNKKACEDWCGQHKNDVVDSCVKCSPDTGCGVGYKVLMSFAGKGKNFHACARSAYGEHSDENRQACQAWCAANRDKGCVKCDTQRYCGPGFEAMKHFDGKGENWHACRKK
jgi:hypothetical protein